MPYRTKTPALVAALIVAAAIVPSQTRAQTDGPQPQPATIEGNAKQASTAAKSRDSVVIESDAQGPEGAKAEVSSTTTPQR